MGESSRTDEFFDNAGEVEFLLEYLKWEDLSSVDEEEVVSIEVKFDHEHWWFDVGHGGTLVRALDSWSQGCGY